MNKHIEYERRKVENGAQKLVWGNLCQIETRFHNLQRQALTQFIKLYQYMT